MVLCKVYLWEHREIISGIPIEDPLQRSHDEEVFVRTPKGKGNNTIDDLIDDMDICTARNEKRGRFKMSSPTSLLNWSAIRL